MQMQIENPYLKQKSELVIMIDRLKLRLASENTDRLKAELVSAEELLHNVEAKSREFNAQILSSFNSEVEKVITKSIEIKSSGVSISKQYNEFKELHREVKRLAKRIGEAKIQIIREMRPKKEEVM